MLADTLSARRDLARGIVRRYETIFVDLNGISNADGVTLLKELVRAGINMVLFCPAGDALRTEMALDVLPIAKEISVRRSEEHTSELQSLMLLTYAVFCL